MMRIRSIKPEFFRHADLYDAEVESGMPLRVAFAGLWCASDREGRFKWRPRELKIEVLPHDNVDFPRVLDALTTRGFVVRYRVDGVDYGWIPSFARHQVINNREKASDLPSPNETNILTRERRDDDASGTREARGESGREGKGREGKDIPTTSGADAPLSGEPDVATIVFTKGLTWLQRQSGKTEAQCRPLLGKWRKEHGDEALIAVLGAAQREAPMDCVGWIEKALRQRAKPRQPRPDQPGGDFQL